MSATEINSNVYEQGMLALMSSIEYIRVSKNTFPTIAALKARRIEQRRDNVLVIVEDNLGDAVLLSEAVKENFPGVQIITCNTVRCAYHELAKGAKWMVVDWSLPDGPPLSLLGAATETGVKVCVWSSTMILSRLGIPVFNKEELTPVVDWLKKIKPSGICNSKY